MRRDVFEVEEVAALMNNRLVAVKLDREQRPDVDARTVYCVQPRSATTDVLTHSYLFLQCNLSSLQGALRLFSATR